MGFEQYCELQKGHNVLTDVEIDYEYSETLAKINAAFQKVKK